VEDEALSGSPPDRATVRLPAGLLGMLALVLAVEAAISGRRDDLVTPWVEDWRVAARAADFRAPGCDVLCFGDSLAMYGLLPKVIEARTGLRAYNLATNGGTMPSSFFLLRRALESGARPRAIVADFAALMLKDDDNPPKTLNYPELATLRDCLDLAWASRDASFFGSLALGKLLPSSRWRFEIRANVLAALEGRSTSLRQAVISTRELWAREAGAQPTRTPARIRHPQEDFLIESVSPETWAYEPKYRAYLERFLSLAESRGIAVYWLVPPMAPEVHARRALRGADVIYDRFAREVAARHPNTVILDARGSGYDDSAHVDFLHLNRRGAAVLSADVAAVVADGPLARPTDGPAWVALPALGGRTGDEPGPSVARSPASTTR
jgi:hypothetical protein